METCAQKNQLITPGIFEVFYHTFGTRIMVCKGNRGNHQLKLIFANLLRYFIVALPAPSINYFVKHIHRLEGFKKLANIILGTFKGMIFI